MSRAPEVRLPAALSEGLRGGCQTAEDLNWLRSPFGWIRSQMSRRKGAIGEELVAGWRTARDINVLCPLLRGRRARTRPTAINSRARRNSPGVPDC